MLSISESRNGLPLLVAEALTLLIFNDEPSSLATTVPSPWNVSMSPLSLSPLSFFANGLLPKNFTWISTVRSPPFTLDFTLTEDMLPDSP
jgi:hypothetical protein